MRRACVCTSGEQLLGVRRTVVGVQRGARRRQADEGGGRALIVECRGLSALHDGLGSHLVAGVVTGCEKAGGHTRMRA
jgi:hypothetical protein